MRDPTRAAGPTGSFPATGSRIVPTILAALDEAGWQGLYDLEIFSDNGTFGTTLPDSLWNVPAAELARRGRAIARRGLGERPADRPYDPVPPPRIRPKNQGG